MVNLGDGHHKAYYEDLDSDPAVAARKAVEDWKAWWDMETSGRPNR